MEGGDQLITVRDIDRTYIEFILADLAGMGYMRFTVAYAQNSAVYAFEKIDWRKTHDSKEEFVESMGGDELSLRAPMYWLASTISDTTEALMGDTTRRRTMESFEGNGLENFTFDAHGTAFHFSEILPYIEASKNAILAALHEKLRMPGRNEDSGEALAKMGVRRRLEDLLTSGDDASYFPFTKDERDSYNASKQTTSTSRKANLEKHLKYSYLARLDKAADEHAGLAIARFENALEEVAMEYRILFYILNDAYMGTFGTNFHSARMVGEMKKSRDRVIKELDGTLSRRDLIEQSEKNESRIRTLMLYEAAKRDSEIGLPLSGIATLPTEMIFSLASFVGGQDFKGYELFILAEAYGAFLTEAYKDEYTKTHRGRSLFGVSAEVIVEERQLRKYIAFMQASIETDVKNILSGNKGTLSGNAREIINQVAGTSKFLIHNSVKIFSFGKGRMLDSTKIHLGKFQQFLRARRKMLLDVESARNAPFISIGQRLAGEAKIILDVFSLEDMHFRVLLFLNRGMDFQAAALEEIEAQINAIKEFLSGVPPKEDEKPDRDFKRSRIGKARFGYGLSSRASVSREPKEKHEKNLLMF